MSKLRYGAVGNVRDGRTGTEPRKVKEMFAKQERCTFEYTCHEG